MENLEKIDDELDAEGVHFVKLRDGATVAADHQSHRKVSEAYGISKLPALVYYRNELPSLFEGESVSNNSCFIFFRHIIRPQKLL